MPMSRGWWTQPFLKNGRLVTHAFATAGRVLHLLVALVNAHWDLSKHAHSALARPTLCVKCDKTKSPFKNKGQHTFAARGVDRI